MNNQEFREKLATLCHDQWAGWMRYLFGKCRVTGRCYTDGVEGPVPVCAVEIPAWAVERWQRQMITPYPDLSEDEKESDRKEADGFLKLFKDHDREKKKENGKKI